MNLPERIALIDMDGTVVDYDGQMKRDLEALRSPNEPPYDALGPQDHAPHIEARMSVIKRQPGWWRNLPEYPVGMGVVAMLRELGFSLNILTKGPYRTTAAWMEKVDWVRSHIPDAAVTITEDKGLVYGKVLVDDWPPYIQRWLAWRPRGLVIMPDHPWNADFTHPNVIQYDGCKDHREQVYERLREIAANTRGDEP